MAYKIVNISAGDLLDLRMSHGSSKIVAEITPAMRRHEQRRQLSILNADGSALTENEAPATVEPSPTPATDVKIESPAEPPVTQETPNVSTENAPAAPTGDDGAGAGGGDHSAPLAPEPISSVEGQPSTPPQPAPVVEEAPKAAPIGSGAPTGGNNQQRNNNPQRR